MLGQLVFIGGASRPCVEMSVDTPRVGACATKTLRRRSVLLEEMRDGHDALVVIRQVIFLVGRVQAVVRQPESHQHSRDAQMVGEIAYDRNRSARADEYGRLLEN